MSVKLLHAADLHLDSPFEGLSAAKAALRRREQRELLQRLGELVRLEGVQLVLLAGDLLDSSSPYYETGEELCRALEGMRVPVFISPGNHDYYSESCPYARLKLPENVHVFRSGTLEPVELPNLGVRVYGAAFTEKHSKSLLEGFRAVQTPGVLNLLCLHGEVGVKDSAYNPISPEQLSRSGIDYAALGHIHKESGLQKAGRCRYAWPGCPEGRGFDETGEKHVYLVEIEPDGVCHLRARSVAKRRYEQLRVDLTGSEALLAIHTQLPDDTVKDVYRITLFGEVDTPPDLTKLRRSLDEFFFELQLRDETRLRQSVWEHAREDSLRGLFLKELRRAYDASQSDAERQRIEQAARWGLAALEKREEVERHDDP